MDKTFLTEGEIRQSKDHFYSDEVANMLGKDIRTIYRWNRQKKLIAEKLDLNGRRVYTLKQLNEFADLKNNT